MTGHKSIIGILGGSFDPIHKGHIAIAEAALLSGKVDEVWLMVSPENPLKKGRLKASEQDRLRMAELSVSDLPSDIRSRMKVSDFEFTLSRPSYTIQTLRALKESYPHYDFLWIIGGDNLSGISKWYKPGEIIRDFGLLIYPRPGDEDNDLIKIGETIVIFKDPEMRERCHFINHVPLYPHSSTSVRTLISEGKYTEVKGLIGDKVLRYIKENKIYK